MGKEMKNFTCKNRNCRRVVGKTDGAELELWTGRRVPQEPKLIGFDCPFCGSTVVWKKTVDKNGVLCFN
jgi:predicted RNA-binding Zn-ribbon protein involved in translation (DUF1610 family)